jgi:hypothetical protein
MLSGPYSLLPALNTRDSHHKHFTAAMLLYLCSRRNPGVWR